MKKILLTLCLLPLLSFGQKNFKQAEEAFKNRFYYQAGVLFEKSLEENGVDKGEAYYYLGECQNKMNHSQEAYGYYKQALSAGYQNPAIYFPLAEAARHLGEYEEAETYYKKHLEYSPKDPLAQSQMEGCKFAKTHNVDNPYVQVKEMEGINTSGSEYGLGFLKDKLIYSSTGAAFSDPQSEFKKVEKFDNRTGLGYSKMYQTTYNEENLTAGQLLDGLNGKGTNTGSFVYDNIRHWAYFTRCDNENCRIYRAVEKNDGKWEKPKDIYPADKSLSMAHPTLSQDGKVLYFSSTMPGGYGGSDIWYMYQDGNGNWGIPINAGKEINTTGNESFPFLSGDTTLFFASDGHPGFGGLDIFKISMKKDPQRKAQNLKRPYNSTEDDFNLIVAPSGKGLFVSFRDAKENDNIFSFNHYPNFYTLSGTLFDGQTKKTSDQHPVELLLDNTVIESQTPNKEGNFFFFLEPNKKYTIQVKHENADSEPKEIQSKGKQTEQTADLYYYYRGLASVSGKVYEFGVETGFANQPVTLWDSKGKQLKETVTNEQGIYRFEELDDNWTYEVRVDRKDYNPEAKRLGIPQLRKAHIFEKASGSDMDFALVKKDMKIILYNILYDFNSADLRSESFAELDKIVAYLEGHPTMQIEIGSHTDARGSAKANKTLSQKRAASASDYIVSKGIAKERIKAVGYGKDRLLVKNAKTEEEHQMNRRTEFKLKDTDPKRTSSATPVTANMPEGVASSETVTEEITIVESQMPTTVSVQGAPKGNTSAFGVLLFTSPQRRNSDSRFDKLKSSLGITVIEEHKQDGLYYYYAGKFETEAKAQDLFKQVRSVGVFANVVKE